MLLCRTLVLLAALSLAACGGAPLVDQATVPAASALPTVAPPSRETFAPPPTQPPAPSAPPRQSPATAHATALPPTHPPAESRPTEGPPVVPVTQPPATAHATAVPPTQPPVPTALPPTKLAPTTHAATSFGSEILFLRKGALIAFDTSTHKERQIGDAVIDFAAAPGGALIALIRGVGRQAEIWTVRRDGSALTQLTTNDRAESRLAWSPDGSALVYGSSSTESGYQPEWIAWSAWCVNSEVRVLNRSDAKEASFGPGCDPVFSPDGKRIAYAMPPNGAQEGLPLRGIQNTIRLINRQGQHGWNLAVADGGAGDNPANSGLLVYAPAWSPDGQQIVYHRYLGYQALVDLDLTEIAGSFDGKGQPLDSGAGWLLPARFAPDRQSLAITEHNPGDARGFGGYDNWAVTVTRLGGTREIALPTGTLTAVGQRVDRLARGQAAAWSPDSAVLAVELPPGWNAQLTLDQPVNADGQPGEIWRWQPGSAPSELLVKNVDFASPLAWLAGTS